MGVLSKIFGIGGDTAAKPIEAIGQAIDAVSTTDEERLQAQAVVERLRQNPAKWQAMINMMEARHRSVFVAGWRPFIGWVCGWNLFYLVTLREWLLWLFLQLGMPEPPPPVGVDMTFELVIALLGLGTLRTFEKMKGVSK